MTREYFPRLLAAPESLESPLVGNAMLKCTLKSYFVSGWTRNSDNQAIMKIHNDSSIFFETPSISRISGIACDSKYSSCVSNHNYSCLDGHEGMPFRQSKYRRKIRIWLLSMTTPPDFLEMLAIRDARSVCFIYIFCIWLDGKSRAYTKLKKWFMQRSSPIPNILCENSELRYPGFPCATIAICFPERLKQHWNGLRFIRFILAIVHWRKFNSQII